MQTSSTVLFLALLASAIPASAQQYAQPSPPSPGTPASPAPDAWGQTPPAWLTAAAVSVKEGYDTNLFGTSANLAGHPDIADDGSAFTTVSANLTFDLLAASGTSKEGFLSILTLAYAADYTVYEKVAREDNLRNTFSLLAKGKSGPWSLSVDNPLIYVDGSKEDPFYSTFTAPGFSAALQRRNQIQERNASVLRYDASNWFARAVANATYLNMMTDEHNPIGVDKGYLNWVNRDDINAGADLGYKLTPDFAFTAGWRLGSQTQAQPYYSLVDNDNTYNRALFGFEGMLRPWLKASVVAGPDFRRYSDAAHPGLAGDRHTWLYMENLLTATFTPMDTLTAANKVWHFVAAPGLTSDQETADSLTYKHAFTKQLSVSAGVKIVGFRYDAPTIRNDWATSYPIGLTYAFNPGLSLSADYVTTAGRTPLPASVAPGRDWNEDITSISLKASF
jgi:hypothetical protein